MICEVCEPYNTEPPAPPAPEMLHGDLGLPEPPEPPSAAELRLRQKMFDEGYNEPRMWDKNERLKDALVRCYLAMEQDWPQPLYDLELVLDEVVRVVKRRERAREKRRNAAKD